jgi:Protein of unknown function (DUF1552)
MAHIVRHSSLSRRTFLRGAGAAIALPWLDAMHPALRPLPAGPTRSLFLFAPNGKIMADWVPKVAGREFELPFLLEPLRAVRDAITVVSRAGIDAGRSHGDGPGDHARAAASYLTCAHPRKTGGADIHVGISIDQWIARHRGQDTPFPSLEFGMEGGRKAGKCDSGYSCAYSNNISWRAPATPVAKEVNPRAAFERMFGDLTLNSADEARRRRRLRSVLDTALEDAKRLSHRLGPSDRNKLDDYLTAVREVEIRLDKLEKNTGKVAVPDTFWRREDAPRFASRLELMYDLILLALQTDQTRTATFMLGNAGSNRSYRFLDVPDGHHYLSHHRRDPEKIAKVRKINRFHIEKFAAFLAKLRKTTDGEANLLDRSMIIYGSGIGDGNRHNHSEIPVLVAGGGNGRLHPGRHLRLPKRTPMANVYLSILDALDIEADSFADSTGRIEL